MSGLNTSETQMLSDAHTAVDRIARRLQRAITNIEGHEDGTALQGHTVTLDAVELNWIVVDLIAAKGKINTVKQMKGYYPQ
jgi:hypothetical protein